MKPEELIKQANRIMAITINDKHGEGSGLLSEALEFLKTYAGKDSVFYKNLATVPHISGTSYIVQRQRI